jgi:hypothetical protein
MKTCSVLGCTRAIRCKGVCPRHYGKLLKYGDASAGFTHQEPFNKPGDGYLNPLGYVILTKDRKAKGEHVRVAEAALGKPLPPGAEVHHWNEIRSDNRPENLVICPSTEYHKLLHMRAKARDSCGNADWRRCYFCKTYDDPKNLYINGANCHHRVCKSINESSRVRSRSAKPA